MTGPEPATGSGLVDAMTVAAAREAVFAAAHDEPGMCPVCGQTVFLYPRTIYSTMARELIACYRAAGTEWFHLPTVLGHNGGDTTKLAAWGLLEPSLGRREDGGRNGVWRITPAGVAFIAHGATVPRHALIYNRAHYGFSGEAVSIRDCLGDGFDLRDLLYGDARG